MKGNWLPHILRPAVSPENGERATDGGRAPGRAGHQRGLLGALCLALAALAARPAANATAPAALAPLGSLPLCFEANHGQAGLEAQFVARSRSGTFLLGPAEATVILATATAAPPGPCAEPTERPRDRQIEGRTIVLQFIGANPQAAMAGQGMLSGRVNYFLGSDPADWRTDLPLFGGVRVTALYPGVDLVYYGNQQKLEYDFIVAPGADTSTLCLRVVGADRLELDAQGDLLLSVGAAQLRQHKPIFHQVISGVRRQVIGGYRLKDPQTVTFEVGNYDPQWPLTIDPVLSYASYFGGASYDAGYDIAVDGAGNVYIAGETLSAQLPTTPGAFQVNYAGGYPGGGGDAFIAKFDNACSNLIYMTYLGGTGDDGVLALAVDATNNVYLTGFTDSRNFPLRSSIRAAITGTPSPYYGLLPFDAFVTKLNPSGDGLEYSTYIGGDTEDEGIGIAVDSAGSAYITGFTDSTNFRTTNAYQTNLAGSYDAFVAKLSPAGTDFDYSTYLGGTNADQGSSIAVDALGRAFVTGVTSSTNFPTTNAIQPWLAGGYDAFVTVIGTYGTNLVRSTYLGGAGSDSGCRATLDSATNAHVVYVVGATTSTNFPIVTTHGALSPTNHGGYDAFVTAISTDASALLYSGYLGGSGDDYAYGVALDSATNAYVVGQTASADFPTRNASGSLSPSNHGGYDSFATALNPDASAFLYSVYLGGSGNDYGYNVAVDPAGNAYIIGQTLSTDFPTKAAFQPVSGGSVDVFIAKIELRPFLDVALAGGDVQLKWPGFYSPVYALETTPTLPAASWTAVSPPPVIVNGWYSVTLPASGPRGFFRLRRP